jgi:hypothetical protein
MNPKTSDVQAIINATPEQLAQLNKQLTRTLIKKTILTIGAGLVVNVAANLILGALTKDSTETEEAI